VSGREGGVKRRKRILLEQPKVFTSNFFKETKHCLGVQKGNKEMVCGMHALLCLFGSVCLAMATTMPFWFCVFGNGNEAGCF
jgi:hypothetical protein